MVLQIFFFVFSQLLEALEKGKASTQPSGQNGQNAGGARNSQERTSARVEDDPDFRPGTSISAIQTKVAAKAAKVY